MNIATGLRVDGHGGVLMGDMTGGECSVVCGLIHGGIWETQDLGASGSNTPVKKVRETQTPPWCIPSLKNVGQVCFAQACCNGLVFVHQVFRRAEHFMPCTSEKISKFC